MRLNATVTGHGFPVVFLHAFPLSSAMWNLQSEAVAASGMSAIALDFRGFGLPATPGSTESLAFAADDVAETLDSLGIERAAFVALSMGGYVFFEFLARHRERVEAAVLCDTTAAADTHEKKAARRDLIAGIKRDGTRILADRMLPNLVTERTLETDTATISFIRRHIQDLSPKAAIAALAAMADRSDHSALLKTIDFPVLFIFGNEDTITSTDVAAQMHAGVPNNASSVALLPGAGHLSNLENPNAFNGEMLSFLLTVSEAL